MAVLMKIGTAIFQLLYIDTNMIVDELTHGV